MFLGNSSELFPFSAEFILSPSLAVSPVNLMNSELQGKHNLINCTVGETTFRYYFCGLCLENKHLCCFCGKCIHSYYILYITHRDSATYVKGYYKRFIITNNGHSVYFLLMAKYFFHHI